VVLANGVDKSDDFAQFEVCNARFDTVALLGENAITMMDLRFKSNLSIVTDKIITHNSAQHN
jgi:hypothetical protein